MDERGSGTRARILATALELFAQRGYHRTSIRQLADRLGIVKTAVLYHFPTKIEILVALATPLLDDWESALTAAAHESAADTAWATITGILEVNLKHRKLLRTLLHDLTMLSHEPMYRRFVTLGTLQHQLIAGPHAGLAEKIRAAQVVAILGDPVVLYADAPTDTLRREVLAGVHRLVDEPATVRPSGQQPPRRSGRPRTLSPAAVASVREMHASGKYTAARIAERLGISRATVYRYLASNSET